MKMRIIPTKADLYPRWTEMVVLSNTVYTFSFSWNSQMEFWELTIYDDHEELIVGGIRLVTKIDMLDEYRYALSNLPEGELVLYPNSNNVQAITRDNLTSDYNLCYITED